MSYVLLQDSEESYKIPREIKATLVNLDAGDDVLTQNAQRAYLEQYASDLVGNSGEGMITLNAIAAHDQEVLQKRIELFETTNEQAEFLANKRGMFERHILAMDLRIQRREAEMYLNLMETHGMKDKLRDHMCRNGARREHAEKAVKAYEEYSQLKRQEINGELDKRGALRLKDLEQSELVKFAEKHIEKLAKKFGLHDTRDELAQLAKSKETSFMTRMRDLDQKVNGDTAPAETQKTGLSLTFTDVSLMLKEIAANPVASVQKAEKKADISAPALVPA